MLKGQKTSATNCDPACFKSIFCMPMASMVCKILINFVHVFFLGSSRVLFHSSCVGPRFKKHDLALDVPISWVEMGESGDFPVLSIKDTIAYLVKSKNLGKLVGDAPMDGLQSTLLEFWRRYAFEWPDFGIYDDAAAGKLSLSRAIPTYIHGDEGRGFKRSGVMILSLQGALGRGSKPFQKRHPIHSIRKIKMGVNLQGSSFNSRFSYAAMPKRFYNSTPESCLWNPLNLWWVL